MEYQLENIKVRLKTMPVRYDENCRPPSDAVYQEFDAQNAGREVFDMWEMSMPNSLGWLGVVDEAGETAVEGEFKTYTHAGSYSKLMEVCKGIASSQPSISEFYCIYLNSPADTEEENLRTKIIFKN
ncbi:hypothetical protein F4X86_00540 [Candidatus Saccharibacteria bacterium]|nr:hypothetical protein [Candidatus Saccharibacteria bacterium]